jgi:hypothetical protein
VSLFGRCKIGIHEVIAKPWVEGDLIRALKRALAKDVAGANPAPA